MTCAVTIVVSPPSSSVESSTSAKVSIGMKFLCDAAYRRCDHLLLPPDFERRGLWCWWISSDAVLKAPQSFRTCSSV